MNQRPQRKKNHDCRLVKNCKINIFAILPLPHIFIIFTHYIYFPATNTIILPLQLHWLAIIEFREQNIENAPIEFLFEFPAELHSSDTVAVRIQPW